MKLDKKRLLECLEKEEVSCGKRKFQEKDRFYMGRETAIRDVIARIELGEFDVREDNQA
ncbi:hypothetical protein PA598K_01431 [Paenibacillus sp. 598K]|uniref:hypothetical protein n=1 Tax=Paenibacillus sp. 598K TaxID=1117987 RepID=UPI000FFAFE17|nr:hypothetical protein [Paenibacillus sp. 598K]GBF73146.1 hypothetical protein PA598K_01431 [Paenibacillus sp. 598K]